MTFHIRTIDTLADGREIVRDRTIAKDLLTLGRNAENDIHLPDLAVDPAHATLALRSDGCIEIAAIDGLRFEIDGRTVTKATIDPGIGAELRFGGYRLRVSSEDRAPMVTIAPSETFGQAEGADPKASFTLKRTLPSKRALSWLLAMLVLGFFLGWPVASNLMHWREAPSQVAGDKSWTPGPLSAAHHALEVDCKACHVEPFVAVRDTSCRSCHNDIHDHAPAAKMSAARGPGGLDDRLLTSVAHAFGKPGPGACVDCHTEHQSAGAMPATPQKFCADCHGDLKGRVGDTGLGNAADFGTLHPQFTVRVTTDPLARRTAVVSLDSHPQDRGGLTFPHDIHLAAGGGVARMAIGLGTARGYGKALTCASCHHSSEDGVRFKPVEMERDCQACHSLGYDRVGGTVRTLRHGDIDQMIADLRASNHRVAPLVGGRRRPGAFASQGPYYASFSVPGAGIDSVSRALAPGGVCGECHTARFDGTKPGVVPVTQPARFMAHGWFDHRPHAQEPCATCHAAARSHVATDLLLPGITTCRNCHLGEGAHAAEVPSSCAMCHVYHPTPLAPRPATDKLRQVSWAGPARAMPLRN